MSHQAADNVWGICNSTTRKKVPADDDMGERDDPNPQKLERAGIGGLIDNTVVPIALWSSGLVG